MVDQTLDIADVRDGSPVEFTIKRAKQALKAEQEKLLSACKAEVDAVLRKYGATIEFCPALTVDGRIVGQGRFVLQDQQ